MRNNYLYLLSILILISQISCNKNDDSNPTNPTEQKISWSTTNLSNGSVWGMTINNSGNIIASISGDAIYISSDKGSNWSKLKDGAFQGPTFSGYAECFYLEDNEIWVGTYGAGIHHSTDNGTTWVAINNGEWMSQNYSIQRNIKKGGLFCGSAGGTFIYGSNGWEKLDSLWSYSILINSSGDIFTGGENFDYSAGSVARSTDNGNNWSRVNLSATVRTLAINSSGNLFAGTENGVFRSTDNGNSWIDLNLGINDLIVFDIAISRTGKIFVSTKANGIFYSLDNGNSWSQINDGLTNLRVNKLLIDPSGYVFAGSSSGVFRASVENL